MLRSGGIHNTAAATAGLAGAEPGFEAHDSLLDLRNRGALSATVQAGWGNCGGHGLLDKVVDPLARVLIHVYFGKQSGDSMEAGFVAIFVTEI